MLMHLGNVAAASRLSTTPGYTARSARSGQKETPTLERPRGRGFRENAYAKFWGSPSLVATRNLTITSLTQ
jgi:hypothetical protein